MRVGEKPTATHVLAPVVTETLKSTLSPSSLTIQASTYDDVAEGDQVILQEGSGAGDGDGLGLGETKNMKRNVILNLNFQVI